ncbi:MAG: DUF6249 domain-containing protein [Cytophagales bacterium]|nr:DUF6249 domain-containing protein [Cytophagales bacterium]
MESHEIIIPVLGILLPIIITLAAFVMIVYLRKYENVERMSMIEKGVALDLFINKEKFYTGWTVRWSFLLIGIGIGFLIGYWLDSAFGMEEVGYFASLFICGGIGLGSSYYVEEKQRKKESK